MIGDPPSFVGAVKATETVVLPAVAVPMVGASGTVAGVTLFEAADGGLSPTALVATTVQVTGTPLVRPVTVMGEFVPEALSVPQVAV